MSTSQEKWPFNAGHSLALTSTCCGFVMLIVAFAASRLLSEADAPAAAAGWAGLGALLIIAGLIIALLSDTAPHDLDEN